MNLQGKRLLLLGGSASAAEIERYAAANGIVLIATGKYANTPLKNISAESYDVDAVDTPGLVGLVQSKAIDGIHVGCNEIVVPHAIRAAHTCGLPCYCTEDQWRCCANKKLFKQLCRQHGISVAHAYAPGTPLGEISYPVVVKPADSCGSQGFSICRKEDEVEAAVAKARSFSASNSVLIEQYLPYDSVIIHYTLIDGSIIFSGMSHKVSRRLNENGSSVMALQLFPSPATDAFLQTTDDKVRRMFGTAGMHDGAVWFEAFHDDGRFTFNEMGFRFGGSMTYYPIRYYHGVDQLELMLDYCLTGRCVRKDHYLFVKPQESPRRSYCIVPLHVHPGTIASIRGEEHVRALPWLYAYVPTHTQGDMIRQSGTVDQVFCYLHVLYETLVELRERIAHIMSLLHVVDVSGAEMLFSLINPHDLASER